MKNIIATILGSFLLISFATGQVAVIANKSVPVDEVSSQQLLDFYTGDVKLWENKDPVIVTDLKPEGEIKALFYEFLGKSPSRMKSIWLKKMLSGEGDPRKRSSRKARCCRRSVPRPAPSDLSVKQASPRT